jgi:hypothetical protein
MLEAVHESGDPGAYVDARLEADERLMGFGHRVYRVRDPRAAVLSAAAERFYEADGEAAFYRTAEGLDSAFVRRSHCRDVDRPLGRTEGCEDPDRHGGEPDGLPGSESGSSRSARQPVRPGRPATVVPRRARREIVTAEGPLPRTSEVAA